MAMTIELHASPPQRIRGSPHRFYLSQQGFGFLVAHEPCNRKPDLGLYLTIGHNHETSSNLNQPIHSESNSFVATAVDGELMRIVLHGGGNRRAWVAWAGRRKHGTHLYFIGRLDAPRFVTFKSHHLEHTPLAPVLNYTVLDRQLDRVWPVAKVVRLPQPGGD
jgi:hypothetical protein